MRFEDVPIDQHFRYNRMIMIQLSSSNGDEVISDDCASNSINIFNGGLFYLYQHEDVEEIDVEIKEIVKLQKNEK